MLQRLLEGAAKAPTRWLTSSSLLVSPLEGWLGQGLGEVGGSKEHGVRTRGEGRRGVGPARHARVGRERFCKMFRGLPRRGPQPDYHGQKI